MPHIIVEYSANVEPDVDMAAFCETMRVAAAGVEEFPVPGIRVRAHRADIAVMADGNPRHGFIDIHVRIGAGRTGAVKRAAAESLFEAARNSLAPVMERRPLALSLEMREIDPDLGFKTGSVRDFL